MGYSLVMYEDKVYLGAACGLKLNRILSKNHTDLSNLTVAKQKNTGGNNVASVSDYDIPFLETLKSKDEPKTEILIIEGAVSHFTLRVRILI